jgi:hypothetical protein
MTPCDPTRFLPIETSNASGSGQHWFSPPPGKPGETIFFVGFHRFGTFGTEELPEPILKRLICHALLQRISDDALSEAIESLSDMYEFYRHPPLQPPALPVPTSISVRMGPGYVRPVFPVAEEE